MSIARAFLLVIAWRVLLHDAIIKVFSCLIFRPILGNEEKILIRQDEFIALFSIPDARIDLSAVGYHIGGPVPDIIPSPAFPADVEANKVIQNVLNSPK